MSVAWTRWESGLVSSKPYANPYADVTVSLTYAGPNGEKIAAHGFWDGGDAFKMRLMFPTAGVWTWKTTCSDTDNSGLHDRRGSVTVADYTGENQLYRHGYLKVSDNRRYLTHFSGKPFLWIVRSNGTYLWLLRHLELGRASTLDADLRL